MYKQKIFIETAIGNTPIISLKNGIYAKIEGCNLFGSSKDRAAKYVLKYLLSTEQISTSTRIIESSSGNFAIALAGVCNSLGMVFTCVIDPLISPINKSILECMGANLILASKPDENNNYLKARLDIVADFIKSNNDTYWINQYDNPLIPNSYVSLGEEILSQVPDVSHIFVPVSTCGTIAGISQIVKQENPSIKIIAVDLDCSNIFYPALAKQHIPGMGLFRKPGNLEYAKIDDVVVVSEWESICECKCLLKHGIFVGVSSGATSIAIKKYLKSNPIYNKIVGVFPDRGERYINTAYNPKWCAENFPQYKI